MQGDIKGSMNKNFLQKKNRSYKTERGAASIFIVIFFALLIGVVTVSFVHIVDQDQQQALNNDLSQSAYDAAKAGVVDANRAIALCENKPEPDKSDCLAQFENKCDDLSNFSSEFGNLNLRKIGASEVGVGADGAKDSKLNQSYTCAKIQYETENIMLSVNNGKMHVLELNSDDQFNLINIKWFNSEDAGIDPATGFGTFPTYPELATDSAQWGGNATPPLLRLQLIRGEPGGGFNLSNLNNNSKTTFLYPSKTASGPEITSANLSFVTDESGKIKYQPQKVLCSNDRFKQAQLACEVLLFTSGNIAPGQKAYLVISPIYNKTTVSVQLQNTIALGTPTISLAKGYPTVDVTGRASDLFRRIKTTINLNGNPNTDIGGDDLPGYDSTKTLCKNFSIGRDYIAGNEALCSSD